VWTGLTRWRAWIARRRGAAPASSTQAAAAEARRPYRWQRREGDRIVTLDDALRAREAETQREAAAIDAQRAASETRARDLEDVVEKLRAQMTRLEETLQVVGQRSRHFEQSYARLKSQLAGSDRPPQPAPSSQPASDRGDAALYARVGLSPDCPDFVLDAARRAFARRYHPDAQAGRDDQDASATEFRYYMRIFDVLQERRKPQVP
jgi:hypothetical protein